MYTMLSIVLFVTNVAVGLSVNSTTLGKPNQDICRLGSIDASTRTQDGTTYLFKGNYYWRYIEGAIDTPRLISNDWKGITGPIDVAFTWNDGSTFIFKGENYWKFTNKEALPGYPRNITDGFRGIPTNVDAALVWQNNGHTYFFKGHQYYRYVATAINPIYGSYPAPISRWRGVPNNVTAAVRWEDGLTYFFKGNEYYKYDNNMLRVPSKYPVSTAKAWFHCDLVTANQTKVWDKYEREIPKKEVGTEEILKAINNLQIVMKRQAKEQQIIQYGTNAVAKEAITMLREIKKLEAEKPNKEIEYFKHTEKVFDITSE